MPVPVAMNRVFGDPELATDRLLTGTTSEQQLDFHAVDMPAHRAPATWLTLSS
jgi:hypothetical protein